MTAQSNSARTPRAWTLTRLPVPVQVGLLGVAYFGLADVSFQLALRPEGIGVWWVPQGVALAALVWTPRRSWPALLSAIFVAEMGSALLHDRPLPIAAAWSVANCLCPWVGARLLRRWPGAPVGLTRVGEVIAFVLVGCIIAPSVAALIAASAAVRWLDAPSFFSAWTSWALSDALGVLTVAPVLLTWGAGRRALPRGGRLAEALVLASLCAAATDWVFEVDGARMYVVPLVYLTFPFTLWAALRFGPRGAATATLLVATVAVVHTMNGTGPFALTELSPRQRVWSLQAYLAIVSLSSLTLAAALEERRASERARGLLVRAGELFAGSLDREATLGRLSRLLAGSLADGSAVLLALDGGYAPVAVAHVDSKEEERLWAQLQRDRAVSPGALERRLIVPLTLRGQTAGYLVLFRSEGSAAFGVQDRRIAEELARRAAQALERMRLFQERGEAIDARDEFLSIAAHELRTPLTTLKLQTQVLAQLIRRSGLEGSLTPKLRVVARQVSRLTQLVEALLDVGRISTGNLELDPQEVDLADVAEDVTGALEEELRKANCELHLFLQSVRGRWDRLRIEQVLTNLLVNAIKFGAGRPIEVRVERGDGLARLFVRDQGMGIAPEAQRRIFDRFERAVSYRSYGGLGLGLYLSSQIVHAHHGHIRVHSEQGSGATFVVELPALPEQRPWGRGELETAPHA